MTTLGSLQYVSALVTALLFGAFGLLATFMTVAGIKARNILSPPPG